MKKYLILGIMFILFQIIGTYQQIQDGLSYENHSIGWWIGSHIMGIAGIASLIKYFRNK